MINLPKVRQSKDYDCGAAIFRSICKFYNVGPKTSKEFIKVCKTKKSGTNPENIVNAACKFGLSAKLVHNLRIKDLKTFLELGIPVICFMQAYGMGHYVAILGFDESYLYFEDPSMRNGRGYLSFCKFAKRWNDIDEYGNYYHHGAIIITKPNIMLFDINNTKEIPNA